MKSVTSSSFILFFCLGCSILAQSQESVSDFLLTAFEDANAQGYDTQQSFLTPRNYRIPIIDEMQLRYGNDEFLYEDAQYALRFNISNPWTIRRNNAFFNAYRAELDAEKKVVYKENMYNRYEIAINYFYQSKLSSIINQRFEIFSTITNTFQQNQESDFFNADDYIESKLDQIDIISELEEAMVETSTEKQFITTTLGVDNIDWKDFNLITVHAIDSIATHILTRKASSAELNLVSKQLEVAKKELLKEKSDFDFGYIQFEYFPFTDKDSEIGISAGITIPIFKKNRPQIAERELKQIELQEEYDAVQFHDSLNKRLQYLHLKDLINHYSIIKEKINELDMISALVNTSKINDYDPISLLELEEGIIKLDEILLKSESRVLEQYLEFLFAFDVLTQRPFINYLSSDLEEIK